MRVIFKGACRKNGKCYLKCAIGGLSKNDSVSLTTRCKISGVVPSMLFPLDIQGEAYFVAVLPLFDVSVLELEFCVHKNGESEAITSVIKKVDMTFIKWESRFNYRFRKELTEEISAIDDECGNDNIVGKVNDVIYSDDGILVHVELSMVYFKKSKIEFSTFDSGGLKHPYPLTVMGDTLIPVGGGMLRRHIALSVELPKETYDFCLSARDESARLSNGFVYLHRNECLVFGKQFFLRTNLEADEGAYNEWFWNQQITLGALEHQRKFVFHNNPLISIVVPLFETPSSYFNEMLESVEKQSYSNWELILVNASPYFQELNRKLGSLDDPRIKVITLDENKGITLNTNMGIEQATGDFIAFLDHDDVIEGDALFEYVQAINSDDLCDLLYSDEDRFDASGRHSHPLFKPDYNKDLLFSGNYITHFLMIRASLIKKVGLTPYGFDGAQDYDLIIRSANCAHQVKHIARVLYHWRMHERSTSARPESKPYAQEAGKKVLEAFFASQDIETVVSETKIPFTYETKFLYEEEPSIDIVIPNKDHVDKLDACLQSILCSDYSNYDITVVENNSCDLHTFEYYEMMERAHDNIHILKYEGEFNFSKIVNYGVAHTQHTLVLLLNNDTEVISNDFLQTMAGYFVRPEVGVVGAKLLYPDKTVQHGGVVVGPNGLADVLFHGVPDTAAGYAGRACRAQDLSAVTGACQMIRRSVFKEVDGYSTEFAVEFNDVDFCLKVREAGYLVVYSPYAKLFHYEFTSRGQDNLLSKRLRSEREKGLLHCKWPEYYVLGDPYYNPNLDKNGVYFKL